MCGLNRAVDIIYMLVGSSSNMNSGAACLSEQIWSGET